jgi:hypothetical protein
MSSAILPSIGRRSPITTAASTWSRRLKGKVSENEYSDLQRNTSMAFDQMMLWAHSVIVTRPTARRGLIHQARYLASQFNDLEGCRRAARISR